MWMGEWMDGEGVFSSFLLARVSSTTINGKLNCAGRFYVSSSKRRLPKFFLSRPAMAACTVRRVTASEEGRALLTPTLATRSRPKKRRRSSEEWGWMKISYFAIILQNYGWPSSSGTGTQSRHQRAPPVRKGKVVPGAAATYIMQIRSRIEMIMRFPWLWVWKGSNLLSQNLPIIHWQEVSNPPGIMVIARCSLARVKSGTKSVSAAIDATGILTPGPYFFLPQS